MMAQEAAASWTTSRRGRATGSHGCDIATTVTGLLSSSTQGLFWPGSTAAERPAPNTSSACHQLRSLATPKTILVGCPVRVRMPGAAPTCAHAIGVLHFLGMPDLGGRPPDHALLSAGGRGGRPRFALELGLDPQTTERLRRRGTSRSGWATMSMPAGWCTKRGWELPAEAAVAIIRCHGGSSWSSSSRRTSASTTSQARALDLGLIRWSRGCRGASRLLGARIASSRRRAGDPETTSGRHSRRRFWRGRSRSVHAARVARRRRREGRGADEFILAVRPTVAGPV